jgi:nitrate reductase NapAB chaperone NapD
MPGLEVHVEQQGKLVVTAEARNVRELAEFAISLQDLGGVISVAPVYHE